ncbi:MAG: hypothetical protein IJX98_03355 [Clostridia bacterium]|nr:hypothetical protein [Clostridia bacterium]
MTDYEKRLVMGGIEMKRLKNGEPVTKEFKDMTEEELFAVDIFTLTIEELEERDRWLDIREKEKWEPVQI